MFVVRGCVAVLSLGLLCLVGETLSSVCCSLPTQVLVPCDRSTVALPSPPPSSTEENSDGSSEVTNDPPTEPIGSDDRSDDISPDPEADQDEAIPPTHTCHEYYCGTVQVEAADTYCSTEPCDSAGCHCAADCIDGSYRSPKWTR